MWKSCYWYWSSNFKDTFGLSSTIALFKVFGYTTISYTHYPFTLNSITENCTFFKRLYYTIILKIYTLSLLGSDIIIVNSRWTHKHLPLSNSKSNVLIVYPPSIDQIVSQRQKINQIVSLGQFRPEKNHQMQLRIFSKIQNHKLCPKDISFVIIGSCRNLEDFERLYQIRKLSSESLKVKWYLH